MPGEAWARISGDIQIQEMVRPFSTDWPSLTQTVETRPAIFNGKVDLRGVDFALNEFKPGARGENQVSPADQNK